MIKPLHILLTLMSAWLLTSCHDTIHIHPVEDPGINEKAFLTLRVDNSAPQLGAVIDYTIYPPVIVYSQDLPENVLARAEAVDADKHSPIVQRAYSLAEAFDRIAPYDLDGDQWELHIKYELYSGTADQVGKGLIAPFSVNDVTCRADEINPEYTLEIPFGSVTVVAVAHIVPAGTRGDWFFDTSTLKNISCNIDRRQGEHDNVYRDCFVAGMEFIIEPTGIDGNVQHVETILTRPQGRYLVLADDYEQYLSIAKTDLDHTTSHIHYPSYINVAYSVLDRRPTSSSYDFGYDTAPTITYADNKPYARLGDDWSFVNGNRSNFNIDITVRDKTCGDVISNNPGILVPVFPGRVSLVVGHWLTDEAEGGGGVSIDPAFTDEIVIRF